MSEYCDFKGALPPHIAYIGPFERRRYLCIVLIVLLVGSYFYWWFCTKTLFLLYGLERG